MSFAAFSIIQPLLCAVRRRNKKPGVGRALDGLLRLRGEGYHEAPCAVVSNSTIGGAGIESGSMRRHTPSKLSSASCSTRSKPSMELNSSVMLSRPAKWSCKCWSKPLVSRAKSSAAVISRVLRAMVAILLVISLKVHTAPVLSRWVPGAQKAHQAARTSSPCGSCIRRTPGIRVSHPNFGHKKTVSVGTGFRLVFEGVLSTWGQRMVGAALFVNICAYMPRQAGGVAA